MHVHCSHGNEGSKTNKWNNCDEEGGNSINEIEDKGFTMKKKLE